MTIERGMAFYIYCSPTYQTVGSEQWAGRPGIVVSNDEINRHSRTVEIVYMTTQPKADLPTHVAIRSLERESTALCEQISSISVERLGDYMGSVTAEEMSQLEAAMAASLGIQLDRPEPEPEPEWSEAEAELERLEAAYDRLKQELEIERAKTAAMKWAHEALLNRVLGKEEPGC